MRLRLLVTVASICTLAFAVAPAAKITTARGLQINGKTMPQNAAPEWPLAYNDEVATKGGPALIVLPRGDRALVEPNSSLRLVQRSDGLALELTSGKVCLQTTNESQLQVLGSGDPVAIPHPYSGEITRATSQLNPVIGTSGCELRLGAFWTSHKALLSGVAGAATAAGVASGKAVASGSPSQD